MPDEPRASLPVRVLVRTDTDWRSLRRDEFAAQIDVELPVKHIRAASKRGLLDVWDAAFALDFLSYRARVAAIAFSTVLSAGADAVTVGIDGFEGGFREWWDAPDDEFLVTVDDDDFLLPDASFAAREVAGADVVLSPQVLLGFRRGNSLSFREGPLLHVLQTNGAIRKSFLKDHLSPETAREVLTHHPVANERIADALDLRDGPVGLGGLRLLWHPRVRYVERCFGLYNHHVGSISFLVEALRQDDPVRYLRGLDLALPRPLPPAIEPLAPALEALESLWQELRAGVVGTAGGR